MISRRGTFRFLATSALACVLTPAHAQAPASSTAVTPETGTSEAEAAEASAGDIIVTARRTEERLQDVPISITVFNQEQLSNRNILNPSDLAAYTPSLSANRQYGTEKSSFSIRGFAQELGTQPSVAVYFADVVAPRANGPTPSGNGTLPGTLFDLQNVQVLKGPQGTLFGRNTTGGAVLLVPRKPSDRFEGYIEGTIGNFGARGIQAVVNAPLGSWARFRIGIDRTVRDGYLRNQSGIGPRDFGNVDYWALRASLVLDFAGNVENYTVATFNDSDTHGTLPRMIACARDITRRFPEQVFADPGCAQLDRQAARGDGYYDVENSLADPQVHLQQWQLINTTSWQLSDTITIKNIFSYAEFRERSRINLAGDRLAMPATFRFVVSPPPNGAVFPVPTGPFAGAPFIVAGIQPGPSGHNAAQYTLVEELQIQGRSRDDRLNWQAGVYAEISRPLAAGTQFNTLVANCTDAATLQCTTPGAPFQLGGSLSILDQKYRFRNYAAYAQASYDITEQFSITAGLRYTADRTTAQSQGAVIRFFPTRSIRCTEGGAVIDTIDARTACRRDYIEKSSRPTWLIDLDYKPSENLLFYAKYARGYRQGTINLLPLGSSLKITGPEKVDSYELGAKATLKGPIRGTLGVAAFYNDFRDQQLQANTIVVQGSGAFPIAVLVNADKSRISGLEVDGSLQLFEGFRVDAGYAYLSTKLKKITLPNLTGDPFYRSLVPTATIGGPLVYSPKHKLTVTGSYTLPVDSRLGRITLGATYTHTDQQFASHADDQYAGTIGFNPGLLPSTDLLNLNLNWNGIGGSPLDLALFATNVTKKEYHVAIFNLLQAGYESAILGEPRVYGARLRVRF